jgi:hypothetical protein
MSAEVPETPIPTARMETLQRLQSTIETLQKVAAQLEVQPQLTVSEGEIEALAALATRLQPVPILPPQSPTAEPIPKAASTPSANPLPEPLPPAPAAVTPSPEPKLSLLERIFARIPLKVSLIAFAIAVIFMAVLVKLLVFPFPKAIPPTGVPQAEVSTPEPSAVPVPAKNEISQVVLPTPTDPTPEVPVKTETPQVVVVPSSNSADEETPQVVVIPSSNSADEETPQVVVIPSSNSVDEETPQVVVIPSSNSADEETPQVVVIPSSNSVDEETPQVVVIPSSNSVDEETPQVVVIPSSNSVDEETPQVVVVPSSNSVTEETPSKEPPTVVTIVPEPAKESIPKENGSPLKPMPVAVEVPSLAGESSSLPAQQPTSKSTPKAQESVPAVPAKPTPEQRFIAAIQMQVTQKARKYVEDPSIKSLNANFEDSILQIQVADVWFSLTSEKQNELADNWLQQSKELDFKALEIVDQQGDLVARSPVIGSRMVILQR